MAKLLLMLREKKLPVQVGFENINPRFADLESAGFIIPRKTTTWKNSQRTPRRAVLNNFGAAGSNASLLLEEWVVPRDTQPKDQERSAHVFMVSAKSRSALQTAVHQHLRFLEVERGPSLKDICYTATARRQIYDHRFSLVCTSTNNLREMLEHYKSVNSNPAQHISVTVFVFSGQGSTYHGMGEELMYTFPPFKEVITTCDGIIQGLGFPSILSIICSDRGGAGVLDDAEQSIVSQCACVALEYALAKTFMLWGIIPKYVMGHRYVGNPAVLIY